LLSGEKTNETYNLGNGKGFSVKEIIETCEKVTEKQAKIVYTERRAGDPAHLIASSQKIYELGWKAQFSLENIIKPVQKDTDKKNNCKRTPGKSLCLRGFNLSRNGSVNCID
jgi:UDP-glucose 4-epimerase